MSVARLPGGNIVLTLTSDELAGVRQSLNEVCHGYKVPNFRNQIGADKDVVARLLDQTTRRNPMKVISSGEDEYHATFTPDEAIIIVNAMKETLREFRPGEFQTRIGLEIEEAKRLISTLESGLSS